MKVLNAMRRTAARGCRGRIGASEDSQILRRGHTGAPVSIWLLAPDGRPRWNPPYRAVASASEGTVDPILG